MAYEHILVEREDGVGIVTLNRPETLNAMNRKLGAELSMMETVDARVLLTREAGLDFEEFYEREHLRLGRALFLLTGNRGEAEDLAQEALARAYERWDRIRETDSPVGYVYRIDGSRFTVVAGRS